MFKFGVAFTRIRRALRTMDVADAAMFELAALGHRSLFEQLVACIISIRTRDEVSLPVALGLFARASSPKAVAKLSVEQIDRLIRASAFHYGKARTIREIARRTVTEFHGTLPCDAGVLTSFKGVGPKCANLALGIACGQARISVDIHVHRVCNRWGAIRTRTPEASMLALEQILPRRYWIEINSLLVPFGKHVCTGRLPKCSSCPVFAMCQRVGVTAHR
jgi:endonuclease III